MGEAIQKNMEELRLSCEREIPIKQQKDNNAAIAFRNYLESIKLTAQQTNQDQVKLGQLKTQLRELEGDLVKALAVKTSKEAKHIMVSDSVSTAKARTEDLKKNLHDLKTRKDEYAAIMSQHLLGLATLEEKANQGIKEKEEIQEVISWYNRVLGLRIEAGRGVKFIFKNISVKDPNEEYSFTVRFAHKTYSLVNCDPHLDGTKELIQELNKTNGFSKFVSTMREKFQAAASNGFRPQSTSTQPDSYTVSVSAPASSLSIGEQGKHGNDNVFHFHAEEVHRTPEKVNRGKKGSSPGSTKSTPPIHHDSRKKISCKEVSPGSASPVRRSARLKIRPQLTSTQPDSYTVSVSAPASSLSIGEQGKHGNDNVFHFHAEEVHRTPEKVNRGKKGSSPGSTKSTPPIHHDSRMKISCKEVSPGSASSVRRSARLKAKTSDK